MSIFSKLRKILRFKRSKALESDEERFKSASISDSSAVKALQSASITPSISEYEESKSVSEAVEQSFIPPTLHTIQPTKHEPEKIELEKNSLQLGVAAGYTGRALKEIEASLSRIESQMITKDWFNLQFKEYLPEILTLLRQHEENQQKRFEALQDSLESLRRISEAVPEPIKKRIQKEIEIIESHIPLTPKMEETLQIIKQHGEISYEDLAIKLGISVSSLRGLLSTMLKRTDQIERFQRFNKGWVRYKAQSSD